MPRSISPEATYLVLMECKPSSTSYADVPITGGRSVSKLLQKRKQWWRGVVVIQEAIELRRALTVSEPMIFNSKLAKSLHQLSSTLVSLVLSRSQRIALAADFIPCHSHT